MAGEGDPWHIGRVSSYQQLFSICCFKKHFFNFLFSNVSGYLLLGARGVPGGGRSGMVPIGQYKIAKFKQQQHPPPKKKILSLCHFFFSSVSQVAAVDGEDSALLAGRQVLDLASCQKSKQLPKLKAKKPHKTYFFSGSWAPAGRHGLARRGVKVPLLQRQVSITFVNIPLKHWRKNGT